ncbi:transporter, major facilitator family protein [Agrilactobacillus composti DSM 18527 = JCM 14202]|uniref:Transporter, major facilitator family protein n=2 Tax=Agrilactobacillus TaxID=2767875 RepID=X0PSW2_9LACO|nr:transporter, major facilitator family protein [Agrilactobacillus composti DSM 18527 = JCM 14202]GAF41022.1 permease [Agrilactobacillus composti DSM 18527 = JCM 14202]
MTTGIVSPALPAIAITYQHVASSLIDQVSTVPSLTMALFVVLSTWIVKYLGTKKTVELGLTLVIVSTLLSLVAPNIWLLIGARALLGAGLGIYNSLAVSLITFSYHGQQRDKLLGWQNAFQGIGATIGSILVAGLIILNWRATFLIYAVAIIILIFYHRNVPDIKLTVAPSPESTPTTKHPINWRNLSKYGFLLFGLMTFYMIATVKIPTYLITNGIGSANTGSLLVGLMSVGTIIAGLLYGQLFNHLHSGVLVLAAALMLGAYWLYGFTSQIMLAAIGAFLIGASFGIFVPAIFGAASQAADISQSNFVSTFLLICSNLANFISPFIAAFLIMGHKQLTIIFMNGTLFLIGLLLVTIWISWRQKASAPAQNENI